MEAIIESPFMTLEEAAAYFRRSYIWVYRRAKAGKIRGKFAGGWLLYRDAVVNYDERKEPVAAPAPKSRFQEARARLRAERNSG